MVLRMGKQKVSKRKVSSEAQGSFTLPSTMSCKHCMYMYTTGQAARGGSGNMQVQHMQAHALIDWTKYCTIAPQ